MSYQDFDTYQKMANRSLHGNEQVLTNCGLGLSSEVGEVVELIQKYAFESSEMDKNALTKELGDVLWYLSQVAEWANISFEEVASKNIEMLRTRFPEKFI